MENFYSELGERIAMLRVQNAYSRAALADKVGISSKFLYEIENGKKGFSVKTLYMISKVFQISSDYLLTGRENR